MANKAFDPTKFRTSLTKSIQGMSAGFNDPTIGLAQATLHSTILFQVIGTKVFH